MTWPSLLHPALRAKPAGRLGSALPARRGLPEADLYATRLHTVRELRVAANFCETQVEALWLLRHLRADPRLGDEQVLCSSRSMRPRDASCIDAKAGTACVRCRDGLHQRLAGPRCS